MPPDSKRKKSPWPRAFLSSLVLLAGGSLVLDGCGESSAPPPSAALVVRVIDGDTLALAGGLRVRLLGLDAPEMEKTASRRSFWLIRPKEPWPI